MKYISIEQQLLKERRENAALRAEVAKSVADIDYIAMMCDVELETEVATDEECEV